jgi:8-oxo-dGTP pyrophosphatase MutT (NUDIX family)
MNPKIISKKISYKASFFNVVSTKLKFPNSLVKTEDFIDVKSNSAMIVAVDNKNNIYLSKEWRPAWRRRIVTIPGGNIKGKDIVKNARRELREEIGFDAKKIERLTTVLLGSKFKRKINIYLATELFESPKKPDADELIDIVKMPIKKACKMFSSGKEMTTAYTILGIILAMNKLRVK